MRAPMGRESTCRDALEARRQAGDGADRRKRAVVTDAELVDRSSRARLDVEEVAARHEVDWTGIGRRRDGRISAGWPSAPIRNELIVLLPVFETK